MQIRRCRVRVHQLDRCAPWAEALEGGHQRVERVRQHVDELARQRAAACLRGVELRRPKGEITVHQRHVLEVERATDKVQESRLADELMTGANQEAALPRRGEECRGVFPGFDERLFDVHVRAGEQRRVRRSEVGARRRADVHHVGLEREQFCNRGAGAGGGTPCEGFRRRGADVVDAHDDVRRLDPSEGAEVEARHVAGPDECDAQR